MEERFRTFTTLISKITRNIKKIKSIEMEEFNLKGPHVSCLYYLYKEETLTSKELSEICDEDKGAISRSLEYLEENGFLICESNAKKRYKSPLKLTPKGKEIGKFITNKIDSILNFAGSGLSEENRTILYDSLNKISENLEKICKEYK